MTRLTRTTQSTSLAQSAVKTPADRDQDRRDATAASDLLAVQFSSLLAARLQTPTARPSTEIRSLNSSDTTESQRVTSAVKSSASISNRTERYNERSDGSEYANSRPVSLGSNASGQKSVSSKESRVTNSSDASVRSPSGTTRAAVEPGSRGTADSVKQLSAAGAATEDSSLQDPSLAAAADQQNQSPVDFDGQAAVSRSNAGDETAELRGPADDDGVDIQIDAAIALPDAALNATSVPKSDLVETQTGSSLQNSALEKVVDPIVSPSDETASQQTIVNSSRGGLEAVPAATVDLAAVDAVRSSTVGLGIKDIVATPAAGNAAADATKSELSVESLAVSSGSDSSAIGSLVAIDAGSSARGVESTETASTSPVLAVSDIVTAANAGSPVEQNVQQSGSVPIDVAGSSPIDVVPVSGETSSESSTKDDSAGSRGDQEAGFDDTKNGAQNKGGLTPAHAVHSQTSEPPAAFLAGLFNSVPNPVALVNANTTAATDRGTESSNATKSTAAVDGGSISSAKIDGAAIHHGGGFVQRANGTGEAVQRSNANTPAEFIARVAEGVRQSLRSGNELRITLAPEELGRLHINVTSSSGVVSAQIEAQTAVGHATLLENLSQLKDALVQQGIAVDRLEVTRSDRSESSLEQRGGNGSGGSAFGNGQQARQEFAGQRDRQSPAYPPANTSTKPAQNGATPHSNIGRNRRLDIQA